jgi:hypothetical protein
MKKEFNSLANNDNVVVAVMALMIVICDQGPKSASFSFDSGFLVEAEPRLENRRGQKALFGQGAHNVFRVH